MGNIFKFFVAGNLHPALCKCSVVTLKTPPFIDSRRKFTKCVWKMCYYRIALYNCDQRLEFDTEYRSRAQATSQLALLREEQAANPTNCILTLEKGGRCVEGHRFYRSGNSAESRAVDEIFKDLLIRSDRLGNAYKKRALNTPLPLAQSANLPCEPLHQINTVMPQGKNSHTAQNAKCFPNLRQTIFQFFCCSKTQ